MTTSNSGVRNAPARFGTAARFGAVALCQSALFAAAVVGLTLTGPVAASAAQSAAVDPATLMQQAAALEAASHWQQAAQAYGQAAKAYATNGQAEQQTEALKKSAAMYEKYADALLKGVSKEAPAAPNANAPTATEPASPRVVVASGAAPLPLQNSPIVHKNKSGGLAVASANGNPIDGVKIPTHDLVTQSPSMVVTPNGVIHIAFLQQIRPIGVACAIYYLFQCRWG